MQALIKQLKQNLPWFFFSALISAHNLAMAGSDQEMQEQLLKARVQNQPPAMDHSAHTNFKDETMGFHGVFYGYLPCHECDGVKTTLSLKQNNNYLLVSQPAKESSREFYDKGKYTWDDDTRNLVLISNKNAAKRQFRIEDEGTLTQLNSDGTPMLGNHKDYTLRRSDTVKSRQLHIH